MTGSISRAIFFIGNRSGAVLTPAGKSLIHHAKSIVLTLDQARHDIGLTSRYHASITFGARIDVFGVLQPRWVGEMRCVIEGNNGCCINVHASAQPGYPRASFFDI